MAQRLDADDCLGRLPVVAAEAAEVDAAAARVREEDRVLGWGQTVERVERDGLQWHGTVAQPCLGVLEAAVRVRPPHVDHTGATVNIAMLKRE